MNTHWNTVWSTRSHRALSLFSSTACCGNSTSTSNSTFSRYGVRIPVKATFCDVTPMTTHINQSKKFFKKYSPLTDRRQKVGRRKKSEKKILTGVRTPDLERWDLTWLGFEPMTWKTWNWLDGDLNPWPGKHGIGLTEIWTHDLENMELAWLGIRTPDLENVGLPWRGFEPITWKTWDLTWNWNCHSML